MAKTDMIRARIEPEIKHAVEALLAEAGLTHSDFVSMIYRQVCKEKALPLHTALSSAFRHWLDSLPVSKNVPNAETARAIRSARAGKGVKRYDSFEAFKAEMNRVETHH